MFFFKTISVSEPIIGQQREILLDTGKTSLTQVKQLKHFDKRITVTFEVAFQIKWDQHPGKKAVLKVCVHLVT